MSGAAVLHAGIVSRHERLQYGIIRRHGRQGLSYHRFLLVARNLRSRPRGRRIAHLSQRELAERSGVSVRTIQELEQGRKDINRAGIDTLLLLAAALSVKVESLVERVV